MSTQPIVPPTPPPERPFGPVWRVGLACGLTLTIGLIAALWPFLRALASALAVYRGWVAAALLLFVAALMVGVVRAVWAWSWRIDAGARQAHIVTLPGGLPAHIVDVPTIARSEAHFTLDRHYAALLADAAREHPNLTSYHQVLHNEAAPPSITDVTPAALSTEPEWLGWTDLTPHLMVAGRTDSGKTTTVEAVLARRILAGDLVLVIDPHYQAGKWLGATTIGGGRDYAACYQAFDATRALLDRRYTSFNAGTATSDFTRITIVVDEVPAIIAHAQMASKALYDRWLLFATSLGSEARKVRISVILLTQSPLVRDIGISSAMRENFTRIALGDTAADLLREEPSAVRKHALLDLLRGRPYPAAMEYRNNWYALRNDDIVQLARTNGAPPRAPSLLLPAAAAPPPTQRVTPPARQHAPSTVPFAYTVQDEILILLGAQPGRYFTGSEIAAAIAVDLLVTRTEIDNLFKAQKIARRKCSGRTTKERYEYRENNQSIN